MKTKVLFCFLLLAFVAAFGAGSTVSVVTLLCPGDTNSHARAYDRLRAALALGAVGGWNVAGGVLDILPPVN